MGKIKKWILDWFQKNFIIRIVGQVLILLFIMIEEIILSPLRKIRILFIEKFIKNLGPYMTIGIFVGLKTSEGLMKFGLIIFKDDPVILGTIVFLDMLFGFISLQILIHGRENLRTFRAYRKVAIWVYRMKRELKKKPIYEKARKHYLEIKEIAIDKYSKVKEYAKKIKIAVLGESKGGLFEFVKAGYDRYMERKRNRKGV